MELERPVSGRVRLGEFVPDRDVGGQWFTDAGHAVLSEDRGDGASSVFSTEIPQREVDAALGHDGNPSLSVGKRQVVEVVPDVLNRTRVASQ